MYCNTHRQLPPPPHTTTHPTRTLTPHPSPHTRHHHTHTTTSTPRHTQAHTHLHHPAHKLAAVVWRLDVAVASDDMEEAGKVQAPAGGAAQGRCLCGRSEASG